MALFPKVGRKQPVTRLSWYAVLAFLCLGIFLHLLPFYFMLTISVKSPLEAMQMPPTLFPEKPTLSAWQLVFNVVTANSSDRAVRQLMDAPFIIYFGNSLFITLTTLAISLPTTALAAYSVSKLLRGRTAYWSYMYFIGTLMVPFIVTLIPSFLLVRRFPFALPQTPLIPGTSTPFPTVDLFNTPWAVIIPGVFSAFNFLLFKGFFDTIPNSIIHAARVDGGSEFNIFRRIVFPMSIPVFAVAAWVQFGAVWDSFLWPQLVLQKSDRLMTSVAIYDLMERFFRTGGTNPAQAFGNSQAIREILAAGLSWNGLMVFGLLQTLPIFLMFILCREYLLRGIRIRGTK